MKRTIQIALALVLAFAFVKATTGAVTLLSGDASTCHTIRPLLVTDDYYYEMTTGCMTFALEADTAGAGTSVQMQTEHCTSQHYDADACITKEFDTNHDGLPDTSVWTGTAGARGIEKPYCGAGAIHFNFTTAPTAGQVPELTVCPKPAR